MKNRQPEYGNNQENVINVATVVGNVQVRSWKDPRVSILISEPILVNMKVGKRVCRTFIDLGSGVAGLMSSDFVKETRIKTSDIRDDLYLRYGNGEIISLANDFTTRLNCNIQGKTFLQRFVVSPAPLPGVDAILGLKFFQEHLGTLIWEGPNKDSVFTFPDGNKWRGDSNPLYADNAIDMCHISAQEASQFIRGYDQRTVDVFVISVTQTLIDKGYMGTGKPDKSKIPKIIQDILEEFLDRLVPLVPEDLPLRCEINRRFCANGYSHHRREYSGQIKGIHHVQCRITSFAGITTRLTRERLHREMYQLE